MATLGTFIREGWVTLKSWGNYIITASYSGHVRPGRNTCRRAGPQKHPQSITHVFTLWTQIWNRNINRELPWLLVLLRVLRSVEKSWWLFCYYLKVHCFGWLLPPGFSFSMNVFSDRLGVDVALWPLVLMWPCCCLDLWATKLKHWPQYSAHTTGALTGCLSPFQDWNTKSLLPG